MARFIAASAAQEFAAKARAMNATTDWRKEQPLDSGKGFFMTTINTPMRSQ